MRHLEALLRRVVLALLASLTACASGAPPSATRFVSPSATQDAILYVMRTDSAPRQGKVEILVDGARVASLPDNRFTWIRIRPGSHDVVVAPRDAFSHVGLEVRIEAEAGKSYLLQYLARDDGGPTLVYGHGRRAIDVAPSSAGYQRVAVLPGRMIDRVVRELPFVEPTM
jgi:hypothetical protein